MNNRLKYLIIIVLAIAIIAVVCKAFVFKGSQEYVATVDGEKISVSEYKFFLSDVKKKMEDLSMMDDPNFSKTEYWSSTIDDQTTQSMAKEFTLRNIKEFKIELIKAKERKLKLDATTAKGIDKGIDSIKAGFGSDPESKFVAQYGVPEKDFRTISKEYTLAKKILKQDIEKDISANESEIKDYFIKNLTSLEKVSVRRILFYTVNIDQKSGKITPLSEAEQNKAKTDAQSVYKKLKAGEDMSSLAKQYSQDTGTKANGGLMDSFKRGDMPPSLEDWAFKAKVGEIKLLKTSYGYDIVRLEKKIDQYNDLKNDAKSGYLDSQYKAQVDSWMKDEKYNLIENNKVLDTIKVIPN